MTHPVRIWLWLVSALVFAMVIVGGATRLTDSGLSITEWQPLLGAIPPLTEAQWLEAFEKYKQIPEYQVQNHWMSLADFKFIYWWEWAHRFLGRIIGAAFLLPFLYFAWTGQITRAQWPRFIALFVLGGLQGALGWYMVASGLSERVDVSQYRLAAHLTLAFILFAALVWTALGIGKAKPQWSRASFFPAVLLAMVFVQVPLGGFVAGLDAGHAASDWPTMNGAIVPEGLAWGRALDDAFTIHFIHRIWAYGLFLLALTYAFVRGSYGAWSVVAVFAVQMLLGIATVVGNVQLSTALLHQAGALVVVGVLLMHLRAVNRPVPVQDQR